MVRINIEGNEENGLSEQKIEETKSALRELENIHKFYFKELE